MREKFEQLMNQGLKEFSIELSYGQMNQFFQYYEMLVEWNKVMNLTAITEMEEVVTKHFLDSLSLVKAVPKEQLCDGEPYRLKVMDLGTGAGFPGIPLKIAFPGLEFTLLDSLNKRIRFLNEVISKLELKHVMAIHGRAEDAGRDNTYRGQYDLCVSRAVANLATLSEYCIPFVKVDGYFIPYKSGKIEEEVNDAKGAVKLLGARVTDIVSFCLPESDMERSLVKIHKIEPTSKKYPRKAGMPGKEPLK